MYENDKKGIKNWEKKTSFRVTECLWNSKIWECMREWDFGFEITEYIHQAPAFADYSIRQKERDSKRKKNLEKEWHQNV